jgi:biopolymer transport protein ExbD
MADIDSSQGSAAGRHGKGKVRGKKISTRVDLTPMVDLAFLLISFFMLTTTLAKPVSLKLNMPQKPKTEEKKEDVKASQVLNIILDENDVIWYYEGLDVEGNLKKTNFGAEGIRKVILGKQEKVGKIFGDPKKKTIVLIKTTKDARYKNMVDILDEMDITGSEVFALQDLLDIEQEAIDETKGQ